MLPLVGNNILTRVRFKKFDDVIIYMVSNKTQIQIEALKRELQEAIKEFLEKQSSVVEVTISTKEGYTVTIEVDGKKVFEKKVFSEEDKEEAILDIESTAEIAKRILDTDTYITETINEFVDRLIEKLCDLVNEKLKKYGLKEDEDYEMEIDYSGDTMGVNPRWSYSTAYLDIHLGEDIISLELFTERTSKAWYGIDNTYTIKTIETLILKEDVNELIESFQNL